MRIASAEAEMARLLAEQLHHAVRLLHHVFGREHTLTQCIHLFLLPRHDWEAERVRIASAATLKGTWQ